MAASPWTSSTSSLTCAAIARPCATRPTSRWVQISVDAPPPPPPAESRRNCNLAVALQDQMQGYCTTVLLRASSQNREAVPNFLVNLVTSGEFKMFALYPKKQFVHRDRIEPLFSLLDLSDIGKDFDDFFSLMQEASARHLAALSGTPVTRAVSHRWPRSASSSSSRTLTWTNSCPSRLCGGLQRG